MQEEDELEAAKKLSRELDGGRRSGSSAGAVAGSPAAAGEQLDSGASRQQPGEQLRLASCLLFWSATAARRCSSRWHPAWT